MIQNRVEPFQETILFQTTHGCQQPASLSRLLEPNQRPTSALSRQHLIASRLNGTQRECTDPTVYKEQLCGGQSSSQDSRQMEMKLFLLTTGRYRLMQTVSP